MKKPKIAVFGNGGREAAIAINLSKYFEIYGISAGFANETVKAKAGSEDNILVVDSVARNKLAIVEWLKDKGVECAVVQQDNMLADGIVDFLRDHSINTFGATQDASRLEWDKAYALKIMERSGLGEYLPKSETISSYSDDIIKELDLTWRNTVVKPNCLTGGKGVKVGDEHFSSEDEVKQYIKSCIENDGSVIVQERISGYEFTIMGITNGKDICFCPPTYDYPYRFDNDTGAGTGGMGCIMDGNLPFLRESKIEECHKIMQTVVDYMREVEGVLFEGCINGGFFAASDGIKFMEFNARLGDPEVHNALTYLGDAFCGQVASALGLTNIPFNSHVPRGIDKSIVVYMVSSKYCSNKRQAKEEVSFPVSLLEGLPEDSVRFASAVVDGGKVKFVGGSRSVAITLSSADGYKIISRMRNKILTKCIAAKRACHRVDFRTDIGRIPFMGLPKKITYDRNTYDARTAFLLGILKEYNFDLSNSTKAYDITNRKLSEPEKLKQKLALKGKIDGVEVLIPEKFSEGNLNNEFPLIAFDEDKIVYAYNQSEINDDLSYMPYRDGTNYSTPIFIVDGKINVGEPSMFKDVVGNKNTNGVYSCIAVNPNAGEVRSISAKIAEKLLEVGLIGDGAHSVQLISLHNRRDHGYGYVFLEMELGLGAPEMFASFGSYANSAIKSFSTLEDPITQVRLPETKTELKYSWKRKPRDGHTPTRPGWIFE